MNNAENWLNHAARRALEYGFLQGQRVQLRYAGDPELPEVLWLLGQEHDCLIFAQGPREDDAARRRFSYINRDDVRMDRVLDAGPESLDMADPRNVRFLHGRVAIHALNLSGSRVAVEITGTEPKFGGVFSGPNHVLGWALRHLHSDLQEKGLLASAESLPLNPRYKEIPAPETQLIDPEADVAATLLVHAADFSKNDMARLTFPQLHTNTLGPALRTPDRVLVWGFEALCREGVTRRLLPSSYRPRIRHNRLH